MKNSLLVPDIIESLVEGLSNKNIVLAEYSIGYLTDAVKSVDVTFFTTSNEKVKLLVRQLVIELDGKRMKVKKGAETIFGDIKNKTSVEQIQKLLEETFAGEDDSKVKV